MLGEDEDGYFDDTDSVEGDIQEGEEIEEEDE